jgi:hypothetical protein
MRRLPTDRVVPPWGHSGWPGRFPSWLLLAAIVALTGVGSGWRALARESDPGGWSFRTGILPILTRAGCNAGTCHGAATGQGGLRLSLLGYDPEEDHLRITRESGGRRIDVDVAAESLLLRKAAGGLDHEGGRRLPRDSAGFRIVHDWIAAGAPFGPRDLRVLGIAVEPGDIRLPGPDHALNLRVTAALSDGTRADVSGLALYSSNDDVVAEVDQAGRVSVRGRGVTSIMVRYSGAVAAARIAVPWNDTPPTETEPPATKRLDRLVDAERRRLHLPASGPSAPEEFLRRIHLDVAGRLPTVAETRGYLAGEDSPERRRAVVDALLVSDAFVDFWTLRLADWLGVGARRGQEAGARAWHAWLRRRVAEGTPIDRLVGELLTAEGDPAQVGPANYFLLASDPRDLAEHIGATFLGTQIACARCHAHPADRWTRTDYHRFAAFLARVARDGGVIRTSAQGEVDDPRTGLPASPLPLGEDAGEWSAGPGGGGVVGGGEDRREALAAWMTAPGNPFFARAFVNRVWKHLFGLGLVEPVDDLRPTNPPANPPLLEALAEDFAKGGFDLRRLVGGVVGSRAYQRSSRTVPGNRADRRFLSHALPRPLPAEVFVDAVVQVTGVPERFEGVPEGTRAVALPGPVVPSRALDLLGRCARDRRCEVPGGSGGGLAQALHLINGPLVNGKLRGGTVAGLLARNAGHDEIVEELYLRAFSRFPDPGERTTWTDVLRRADDRAEAVEDLVWALLNSREFAFNH